MEEEIQKFNACIKRVVESWDVLKRAVDEDWGDYDALRCKERLVEDLQINFKEALVKKKKIYWQDLQSFLVETMDEFFNADVEHTAARPLAKILEELYAALESSDKTRIDETFAKF
eukprot:snap_masked-scaffold_3-processed-gene-3.48-mRNA-1 protein AED:0.99 eAED:1.00 QI:0/-1/0/1/-1/1/1/0/115